MTPNERIVIGVDLGGTNIKTVLADGQGKMLAQYKGRTQLENGIAAVVANIKESIHGVMTMAGVEPGDIWGLGIGSPGPLDSCAGVVLNPPNFPGWQNVPLVAMIKEDFNLPIVLDNDANAATYGEKWQGAGRGANTLICYTLGTGVGGGIIIDGKLVRGPDDTGGELGHCTINYQGYRCNCGNYGCLEAYVSATNIVRRTREKMAAGSATDLVEMVNGELDKLTSKIIYQAAIAGDGLSQEIMIETGQLLGVGIANIVNALNPDVVVIAGGVIKAGDLIFKPAREEVNRRAFPRPAQRVRIVPAQLGDNAGAVGAAGIALAECHP